MLRLGVQVELLEVVDNLVVREGISEVGDLVGVVIVFLHRYITSLTLNEVGILTSRLFRDVPPKRLGLRVIKREDGGHQLQVFRLNIYRRLRLAC